MVILVSFALVALLLTLHAILTAPVGHEDEHGFWVEKKPDRRPAAEVFQLPPQQTEAGSVTLAKTQHPAALERAA